MKKTLVAMAAMSAVASFAQSSVVISGNLDVAGVNRTGTVVRTAASTFTTGVGTSSTTGIKLTATEDLGGGLKLTAMYELDPRSLIDDSYSVNQVSHTGVSAGTTTVSQTTTASTVSVSTPLTGSVTAGSSSLSSTITGLGRHEAYIALSGGFGTLFAGAPNAASLTARNFLTSGNWYRLWLYHQRSLKHWLAVRCCTNSLQPFGEICIA